MNLKQMEKLKRKVAREVSAKRALEEKALLREKQDLIAFAQELEAKHPGRGSCVCIWGGLTYVLCGNRLEYHHEMPAAAFSETSEFELVGVLRDVCCYLLRREVFEEQQAIHSWFAEHYGALKMSLHSIIESTDSAKMSLSNFALLGAVSQEFLKKFPTKTPMEFVMLYKEFDKMILEHLQNPGR